MKGKDTLRQEYTQHNMWLEIDVLLKDKLINWQELGFDIKHEFARRMIRLEDILTLQELIGDIQILTFNDQSSVYIRGEYEHIRDLILHLQQQSDLGTDDI